MKKSVLLLLLMPVLSPAQDLYFPPLDGSAWETISTESLGWNQDSLSSLSDYLEQKGTKAFIMLKNGKIAVEWYYGDFTRDKAWYWASAGKTLTAFLIGQAQEEGLLAIDDKTSKYLGQGWTSCPPEEEDKITLWHQLTMTTGLDDGVEDSYCTLDSCLLCLAEPGERWAYHNAPYTLLQKVIEAASGMTMNRFVRSRLTTRIGMGGLWVKSGYNNLYFSNARSMARFGLLIQNRGVWASDTLLHDADYFHAMTNSSQSLNKSYGYLWWLNGKGSYMLPKLQIVFKRNLIPNAPDDLIAALGKNDQKIYVVDSMQMVVIRMGDAAGQGLLALSSFDNELWGKIMRLQTATGVGERLLTSRYSAGEFLLKNHPNPFNPQTTIRFTLPRDSHVLLQVFTLRGELAATPVNGFRPAGTNAVQFKADGLPGGVYLVRLQTETGVQSGKMILLR